MFNLIQRQRHQQRQRGYIASIGSNAVLNAGGALFEGLTPTVLVENAVKIGEQLAAELVDETERLRPVVEKIVNDLKAAQEGAEQRPTAQNLARAALTGYTGQTLRVDTWPGRVQLFVLLLSLLISYLSSQHQNQQLVSSIRDLLAQYGQEITALAETVRQLQHSQETQIQHGVPSFRVTHTSNLRMGPSAKSRKVAVVKSGALLEDIVYVNRWSYVEVLESNGERTGVKGWVYRRNVRRVR